MKKLINQTGLACPFLSRKLTYLTLLLVSLFGSGGSAWADYTIYSFDTNSYSTKGSTIDVTGGRFYSYWKNSENSNISSGNKNGIKFDGAFTSDSKYHVLLTLNTSLKSGDKITITQSQTGTSSPNSSNNTYGIDLRASLSGNVVSTAWIKPSDGKQRSTSTITVSGDLIASNTIYLTKNNEAIYLHEVVITREGEDLGTIKIIEGTTTTWDFTKITSVQAESMIDASMGSWVNKTEYIGNPIVNTATYWSPSWCEGVQLGVKGSVNDNTKSCIYINSTNGYYLNGNNASLKVTIPQGANTLIVTASSTVLSDGLTYDYDSSAKTYTAYVHEGDVIEIHRNSGGTGIQKIVTGYTELPSGPTATFLYGANATTGTQWISPDENEMTITIPAHKAGQTFNVTVTPDDGATIGTINGGSKNGNIVSFTAPSAGGSPLTVTIPVTKDAVTTNYTIRVNTETALSKVTFDENTRYSKLIIDNNYSNFYANTTASGINSKTGSLDYVPGLVAKAMIEAVDYYKDHPNSDITADKVKSWYEAVKGYGNNHSLKSSNGTSLDDQNAVKLYFTLKKLASSSDVNYADEATVRKANEIIEASLGSLKNTNKTYVIGNTFQPDMEGGWWHKSSYNNQMWCDGQYMGTALLAQMLNDDKYSTYTHLSDDDWAIVYKQLDITYNYLYNTETNLLHHAFAADNGTTSTSSMWSFDKKNGQNNYRNSAVWGRAAGWYFLALVDVLEQMKIAGKSSTADYTRIKGYLSNVAAGLKARQDATTGCWYQLPLYDDTFSANDCGNGKTENRVYNYLESSATAIYTAAYLKGIRLGFLDKATYETTAKKAYQGFVENFINNTDYQIYWCSRSAGIGTETSGTNLRTGSDAYYLRGYDVTPTKITDPDNTTTKNEFGKPTPKGTEGKVLGAFIMAATEYERAYLDQSWTITYGSTDESRGTVTAVYTDGGAEFVSGTVVPNNTQTTFTAMPNPGYKVDMSNPWNNATSKHDNPLTYRHTANRNFFAKFIPLDAPTISAQTIADATYKKNSAATALSVTGATSENGNLSYQWYSNTSNTTIGGTKIDGQTGTTFTPPTKNVGATYYYCEVSETVDRTAQDGDKANGTAICYSDIAKITIAADDCTMEHTGTIYGAIDQTTPYRQARTDVFELKEGEKKVFRFTNHGNSQENYTNWNVAIVSSTDLNSATDDMVMRSDAWGWGKFYNLQPEIKQDGSSINWTDFKNDMNNADVEVEIDYNASTKIISITATSKGSNHTYVETATTNATSGTKGVYFFVDQSHFCDFRELVSIKATASDGCTLNSVVANDVNIGNENNVTYFVEPNSKVVITTTPTSDKYLRTWNVVGTQGEASKVGDQDIYTINTLATNTTVIAKYGLKSSETLPHPENSNYEETGSEPNITYTITLPAFSYTLAGKEQTVALNLPEYATAAIKEGEGRIVGDNLTITAPASNVLASTIITVTAQNGSTQDYTIKYTTVAVPTYNFVVNAVTSSGKILKEITRGNAYSVTVTYPQYILDGTTLYNVPQGSTDPGWYRQTFIFESEETKEIKYNGQNKNNVVFYTEGEDIPGMTRAASSNVLVRASNGAVGYNHEEILVTTIPAGAYTIHARGLNGNSGDKTATFKAGDQSVYELTINTGSNNATGTSQPFYVDKETEIYVSCTGGNSSGLDWFYIEKADVLPVTVNEQKYTLSKDNNVGDNINQKDLFFNVNNNSWTERTVESKKVYLYALDSGREERITVKGAKAFEVITQNASGSDRTYKVSIDETDWNTTVTAKAKTTASSGIFATGNEEEITIILSNANGTVYPYQIIFYTEKPKGELTSSETELKVTDKSHAPIELATNSGGNISMTTAPSTVAEYAEVSFDQQTKGLSITPIKVGTFTLDFSIAENGAYAAGTSTYTVNIRKEQLTMTITPDEGYSWNKTTSPDSQPQLTQPTIVLKDEAGQVVNGKVLTYTSDDPTVATIDGTVIKLAAEPQGSANIYIAFAGDDDYEEVSGIYPILIEQGVSHKFDENTFGGNGPAVGLEKTLYDVKKENGAWVDDTTKPLVYYTFGGWKWGKDGDKNDHKYEVTDAAGKTSEKTDSWTEPALFSGSGGTKPIYVDGYKYAASGAQDAMDESKLLSESPVFGKKRNGWFQSENDDPHIRPFTLPVRGSYIKYDPQVNGYLTVYLLQNGAFNTETGDDGKSYLKVGEFQPHAFHVVDQNGTPVPTYTDFTFVVKEKVTQKHKDGISISCSYEGDKVTKDLDNGFVPNGVTFDEHDVATWPMFYTNYTKKERQDIKDAWSSGINGAQKVVKLHNGSFFLTQKAYVKYTFYVAAGQTYYIFSNFSKIGMSGINFVKDANQPDQENDVLALNDNASFPELKNANTNVSSNLSIPQYGKITVNRSFKKDTWNTICLPFNMTEREVIENFGNDVQILCFDGTEVGDNSNTLHFVYHEIQSILAGYPYLIRPSKEVSGITVKNKMIQPKGFVEFSTSRYWNGTPYVAETTGAYTFKGTIGAETPYKKGDIYMSGTGDLKRMTGESSNLKGYRAYLKSNNTADAKPISVVFSGIPNDDNSETTGIIEITEDENGNSVFSVTPIQGVYNINGQKMGNDVRNLPKGMYIINGKKYNVQ